MTTDKVAAYIRVSDPKQAKRESHQTQIEVLESAALERGYKDIVWFVEPGVSGEEISNRPYFRELLKRTENGEFKVWFIYRVNRIGRFKNPLDRYKVQEIIYDHKIIVDSLNEGVLNPGEDENHLFKFEKLLSAARKSSKELGDSVVDGQNRVRRAGRKAAGGDPFFVDWNPQIKKYELNEGRYETFCKIVRLLQSGNGTLLTADALNANLDKHPPKKAPKWSHGTIWGMFHSRAKKKKSSTQPTCKPDYKAQFYYTGIHWQNTMDKAGNPKPRDEWIPVDIGLQIGRQYLFPKEVIVDVIFRMSQRRKRRKDGEESLFNPDDFLLQGMVQCGECGKHLSIRAQNPEGKKVYRYYICHNRDKGNCSFRSVVADELDKNVLVRFLETVSDPEKLQQAIIEEELLPKSKRRDVEAILWNAIQDEDRILESLDKLEIAHAASRIREEPYERQRNEWEQDLAKVQSTKRKAEHTLSRPDDLMRAAKAASEWLAERILLFKDITPGKKPWGWGESHEKSLLNINNLSPEERRLTFEQMKTMLVMFVAVAGKIKVWNEDKFIIPGILPAAVAEPADSITPSHVFIRGK